MKFTNLSFVVLFVLCCAFLIPGGVSANLVQNGGFEAPIISGDYLSIPSQGTLTDWTIVDGDIELVRDYWNANEKDQSIDLSGCSRGTISQNLATTPGQLYTLTFAIAGNPAYWIYNPLPTERKIAVYWGDNEPLVRTVDSNGNDQHLIKWVLINDLPQFLATADSTTLTFKDVSENEYQCSGVALDDIIVDPYTPTAAPEFPSAFLPLTMIIGLLGAVLLIQRTRGR